MKLTKILRGILFLILLVSSDLIRVQNTVSAHKTSSTILSALGKNQIKRHSSGTYLTAAEKQEVEDFKKQTQATKNTFDAKILMYFQAELALFNDATGSTFVEFAQEVTGDKSLTQDDAKALLSKLILPLKLGVEFVHETKKKWKLVPLFPGSDQIIGSSTSANKIEAQNSSKKKTFSTTLAKIKEVLATKTTDQIKELIKAALKTFMKNLLKAIMKWVLKLVLKSLIALFMPFLYPLVVIWEFLKILENFKGSKIDTKDCDKTFHLQYEFANVGDIATLSANIEVHIDYVKYKEFMNSIKKWISEKKQLITKWFSTKFQKLKAWLTKTKVEDPPAKIDKELDTKPNPDVEADQEFNKALKNAGCKSTQQMAFTRQDATVGIEDSMEKEDLENTEGKEVDESPVPEKEEIAEEGKGSSGTNTSKGNKKSTY